jgi:hypothetical protein
MGLRSVFTILVRRLSFLSASNKSVRIVLGAQFGCL